MTKEDRKKYKDRKKEEIRRERMANKKAYGKKDGYQFFTAIIAAVLCILMLLSVCGTLIAYLFAK